MFYQVREVVCCVLFDWCSALFFGAVYFLISLITAAADDMAWDWKLSFLAFNINKQKVKVNRH